MITLKDLKSDNRLVLVLIKFFLHLVISLFIFCLIFAPYFFFRKVKFKKKNEIIIIKDFYQIDKKTRFLYDIEHTIRFFLKKNKKKYSVKTFYKDLSGNNFLPFNFIQFFFKHNPSLIIFPIDHQNYKTDLNYLLFLFLKLFFKTKIIGICNDPVWSLNFLRYSFGIKIFDGQIAWPYIFFKDKHFLAPQTILNRKNLKKNIPLKLSRKKIDVCFVGRKIGNRDKILNFIEKNGINVEKFGSGYNKSLTSSKFFEKLSYSKIVINFSRNIDLFKPHLIYPFTCRGRIFEAASAGCLMFDEKNKFLDIFFKPYKDYIPYNNQKDLVKKIKYYLKNYNTKGFQIAKNAYLKNSSEFSTIKFWSKLFDEINL